MERGQVYPDVSTERRSILLRRKSKQAGGVDAGESAGPREERAAAGTPGSHVVSLNEGDHPIGISLSGGGIRSASFSLGVLQELQEVGILRRARYLSAVSGGSYIAGAAALAALPAYENEPDATDVVAAEKPFEPGSPEEHYVRNHTTYLLHGKGGTAIFAAQLLLGITINLLFLGLALHAIARPLGWTYGAAFEGLRQNSGCVQRGDCTGVHIASWTWPTIAVAFGVGVAVGLLAVGVRWMSHATRGRLLWATAIVLCLASACVVVLVFLPLALELMRDSTSEPRAAQAASESAGRAGTIGGVGLAGTILAAFLTVRAWIGTSREAKAATTWVGKRFLPFLARFRLPIVNLIAAVAGPLLLAAAFLTILNWGASHPPGVDGIESTSELWLWGGLALLLLVMWRYADLNAWSIHPFYKRRLSSTFALRRVRSPNGDEYAEERPYKTWYRLSQSQPADFPELLICAAANVSDYGRVPTGTNVTSFVFSAESVGGPVIGEIATDTLEEAVGLRRRDLTLPAAVSIAGAAVSPSMGKMTRAPLRFLIALTNLRLGVWIPNPKRVQEFAVRKGRRAYPVNPRPHYLLRELFGRNHSDASFLYVSDGGHYENLGLVELLRRHCMEVWCVDAAGDSVETFNTIAEAMLIAKGELNVELRINPSEMGPDPTKERSSFVRRAYATGTIAYPDGTTGTIVIIKAGVPENAPYEVRAFHANHPTFPCDSTLNQFFSAERFDAYKSLGRFAARCALIDQKYLPPEPETVDLTEGKSSESTPPESTSDEAATAQRSL